MILFVDNCILADATLLMAKTRGCQNDLSGYWTGQLHWEGHAPRAVRFQITSTRQPFGGERRWWLCPRCHRRCRILLTPGPDAPFACRLCWNAQYLSMHPARRRRWKQFEWLRKDWSSSVEEDRTFAFLTARRRRGVRRGRRLHQRRERLYRALEQSVPQRLERWGAAGLKADFQAKIEALKNIQEAVTNRGDREGQ